MKKRSLLQHKTFRALLSIFFIGASFISYSQLPDCGKYYVMLSNGRFNTIDPVSNTTTLNSIILPSGASGLAVSTNYFNSVPSPTYYTVVNGKYQYYNGSTWINTGHSTGNSAAVNPGGAGPYIYNLDGVNAKLYRYDGTGNSTLFLNLGSWSGPYDVMGDASGNVYLLHTGAPQALNMYDVNANLVCSYSLVNMPIQTYGGGYSIVNGIVYTQAGTGSYKGIISGTTITFSPLTITGTATDFANCAFPPINLTIAAPSVLTCTINTTQLSATTSITAPQYTWSGPGIVSGGNTATPTINQPGTYTLTVTSGGGGCAGSATQQVIVTQTSSLTITGVTTDVSCSGSIIPGVNITVTGGTNYTYSWSNGATTEDISNVPAGTYTVNVSSQNGCSNSASFTVGTSASALTTNITSTNPSFCIGGSTNLTATTTGGTSPYTYAWDNGLSAISTHTVSPTVSTTYNCTITDNVGCSGSASTTVTVNPLPTINAGLDQTLCAGVTTSLSGSGGTTYSWNNSVTNGTTFTPSLGTTTYTLTGTDANGCINTDAVNITVNPNPTPVITGTASYCQGQNTTIDAGVGYTTYSWSTGANTQTTNVTIVNNPITVTVTNSSNCSATSAPFNVSELTTISTNSTLQICQGASVVIHGTPQTTSGTYSQTFPSMGGCDSTSNVTLSIISSPIINAGTDQTLCAGTPVTLNASGAGTGGTYTWNNGVPNNVPFTQTSGTTIYTVTGTDANGCTNTDAVNITVNAIPILNAGADQSVCIGTPVTLTANGSTTYSWDNSVTNGTAFTPALGTITYTVTGTTSGCTSTDQVVVTVNPLPTVSATTDTILCEHQSIILVGSGASNYSWNNGITNGVAFTPTATTTYTVTGTDSNGCKNTDDVQITIISTPTVNFVSDNVLDCLPLAFNLTNTSIGNLTNCKWTLSNGQSFTGCGTVTDTLLAVGCYDVTLVVTTPEGCTNTLTKSDYICVAPNPVAKFYTDPNELSSLVWKANMTNISIGATSYQWNFGDNSGSNTETSPSHEFPNDEGKTYTITLIAISDVGCVDSTTKTITVIEDLIYYVPNTFTPDADNFNETFLPVFTSGYDPQDYTLLIFDRWGEILFESHNAKVGWDGTFNGKVSPDGTYIWKITFKLKNKDERQEHVGNINLLR